MKCRYTPRAIADIECIADFLNARNAVVAGKVQIALREAVSRLVLFPHMGRKQNFNNVRKWVIRKYPYILYYTVDLVAKEIVILSVCHHTEQRPYDDAE